MEKGKGQEGPMGSLRRSNGFIFFYGIHDYGENPLLDYKEKYL